MLKLNKPYTWGTGRHRYEVRSLLRGDGGEPCKIALYCFTLGKFLPADLLLEHLYNAPSWQNFKYID